MSTDSALILKKITRNEAETRALGEALGRLLQAGELVALEGELGSGKTVFIQGLARGLGVTSRVRSPSFIMICRLQGPVELIHVDAYRLSGPEELQELGFEEILDSGAVVAVEWAEKVKSLLPEKRLQVRLYYVDEGRQIEIQDLGDLLAGRGAEQAFAGFGN